MPNISIITFSTNPPLPQKKTHKKNQQPGRRSAGFAHKLQFRPTPHGQHPNAQNCLSQASNIVCFKMNEVITVGYI
jgi:hypothetical protein